MWVSTVPRERWPAMRRAGQVTRQTLCAVLARVRPGVTTRELDLAVRRDTRKRRGVPAQLGYRPEPGHVPFPGAACFSVDDVVCHGVPTEVPLRPGQLLSVDCTTRLRGWHGDTCATIIVGDPERASAEVRHLRRAAERCRDAGIAAVMPGAHLGDIGAEIAQVAQEEGVSVVTAYGGHGIGHRMHLPPHVPHVGRRGEGPILRPGACFTVEPMVTLGSPRVVLRDDGWTVATADGSLAAQFEHTLLVTDDGVEILTA